MPAALNAADPVVWLDTMNSKRSIIIGALKQGPRTCSTFKAFNLMYLHILHSQRLRQSCHSSGEGRHDCHSKKHFTFSATTCNVIIACYSLIPYLHILKFFFVGFAHAKYPRNFTYLQIFDLCLQTFADIGKNQYFQSYQFFVSVQNLPNLFL